MVNNSNGFQTDEVVQTNGKQEQGRADAGECHERWGAGRGLRCAGMAAAFQSTAVGGMGEAFAPVAHAGWLANHTLLLRSSVSQN